MRKLSQLLSSTDMSVAADMQQRMLVRNERTAEDKNSSMHVTARCVWLLVSTVTPVCEQAMQDLDTVVRAINSALTLIQRQCNQIPTNVQTMPTKVQTMPTKVQAIPTKANQLRMSPKVCSHRGNFGGNLCLSPHPKSQADQSNMQALQIP